MEKISVIIPAYNEEKNIERTVKSVADWFHKSDQEYEIIVSNDGSRDKTAAIVDGLIQTNSNIRFVSNAHSGKAVTVNSGLNQATGVYCLLMDADGAAHINQLPKLVSRIEETKADIAIGSREGRGAHRISEPLHRHLLGRGFNLLVKLVTGLNFEDTQCGFKLFKTEILKTLAAKSRIMNKKINNLNHPMVTAFDVELMILAQKFGYKIVEVPIEWKYIATKGVNPLRDSFKMLLDIISLRINK